MYMMSIWKKTGWVITSFLFSVERVSAIETGPVTLVNPIAANSFQELAAQVLKVVSSIGGILAVFFIIYAGFLFVTAGGSEEKRKSAKWALLYAIIGTAVLVGAQALALIIETTIKSLQ